MNSMNFAQVSFASLTYFDADLAAHCQRVSNLARLMVIQLGYQDLLAELVGSAGIIHDIGKVGIPAEIQNKPGPLTPEEWTIIKTHPERGMQYLDLAGWQGEPISSIIYSHHERWDGSGYPMGLRGEAIFIGARLVSVADAWDAMLSSRPYKRAYSMKRASWEMKSAAGVQFDPKMVNCLIGLVEEGRLCEAGLDYLAKHSSCLETNMRPNMLAEDPVRPCFSG